jgi:retron-type reverse transcriptase
VSEGTVQRQVNSNKEDLIPPAWFLQYKEQLENLAENPSQHYHVYRVPKKSGGTRIISEPVGRIRAIHELIKQWLNQVALHNAAHGFREGRSVFTNALPHINKDIVVNMDIHSFFNSITHSRVRDLLMDISSELEEEEAHLLANLVTLNGSLATGACTSPVLSNIYMRELDERITTLTRNANVAYTRYADDITLSGKYIPITMIKCISHYLKEYGLEVNHSKFRMMPSRGRQEVTGIIVNSKATTPKELRNRLRGYLHTLGTEGEDINMTTAGLLSYIRSICPEHYEKLINSYEKGLAKHERKLTRRCDDPSS